MSVDDKTLGRIVQRSCSLFCIPGNVDATEGEIRILVVEVVGVAKRAVLEDGNGDVACSGGSVSGVATLAVGSRERTTHSSSRQG